MVSKPDKPFSNDVLVLDFGVLTLAVHGTDSDGNDITSVGTDKGFIALLGSYSFPLGAKVLLLTRGDFLGSVANELMLEDAEVWAEISFADATIEADVVSNNHLLEALFVTNGKIERREN
jgi:hypothetical protein